MPMGLPAFLVLTSPHQLSALRTTHRVIGPPSGSALPITGAPSGVWVDGQDPKTSVLLGKVMSEKGMVRGGQWMEGRRCVGEAGHGAGRRRGLGAPVHRGGDPGGRPGWVGPTAGSAPWCGGRGSCTGSPPGPPPTWATALPGSSSAAPPPRHPRATHKTPPPPPCRRPKRPPPNV